MNSQISLVDRQVTIFYTLIISFIHIAGIIIVETPPTIKWHETSTQFSFDQFRLVNKDIIGGLVDCLMMHEVENGIKDNKCSHIYTVKIRKKKRFLILETTSNPLFLLPSNGFHHLLYTAVVLSLNSPRLFFSLSLDLSRSTYVMVRHAFKLLRITIITIP